MLGTWRAGAVYQPLFTAFGPKAIEQRVTAEGGSGAKLIVTNSANLPKLGEVPGCPPVLEVDRSRQEADLLASLLAREVATFAPVNRRGDDPFVLLYTSGTTGHPKGVLYPLKMLLPVVFTCAMDSTCSHRIASGMLPTPAGRMACSTPG